MPVRRFLVLHFTAGWSALSSIDYWRKIKYKACAHLIIDRDGTTFQCRPFNVTANHAGESTWVDPNTGRRFYNLNHCSIGIEIANLGQVSIQTRYHKSLESQGFKGEMPKYFGAHKHGGPATYWEVFPEKQINEVIAISKVLVERYNLDDVVGHDDIAPNRKNDPGPAFPMLEVREALGFKGLPKLV